MTRREQNMRNETALAIGLWCISAAMLASVVTWLAFDAIQKYWN